MAQGLYTCGHQLNKINIVRKIVDSQVVFVSSSAGSASHLAIPNLSASDHGMLLTCRAGMNITTTLRIRVEGKEELEY